MLIDSFNLKVDSTSRSTGIAGGARRFVLVLLSLMVLLPSVSMADGLFDFQMKMAQKGNVEAQFKVGEMYETGFGTKKDMAQARIWIEKANAKGHETAGFKLLYWDLEKNGITKDNKAAVASLKAKANEGNPQAQYYVGKMTAYGVGTKKNTKKGLDWLNKAALVGVLEAEREMVDVREMKQKQDVTAQRRAADKRRADQKAKQARDRKAREQAQRKQQADVKARQAKQQAAAKEKAKQNQAAAAAKQKANQQAADQARIKAQKDAAARQQADAKRREADKQALIKQREQEEKDRKAQFESDPCSGKSARFLSTCH
ncbi:MAG: sel1 repeat family protein [Proteobacteria bacterium]|nr:sel1 repeat family protein [Pseudomonadota bacterium]